MWFKPGGTPHEKRDFRYLGRYDNNDSVVLSSGSRSRALVSEPRESDGVGAVARRASGEDCDKLHGPLAAARCLQHPRSLFAVERNRARYDRDRSHAEPAGPAMFWRAAWAPPVEPGDGNRSYRHVRRRERHFTKIRM